MKDIHYISKDGENDRVKQKYESPPYTYPSSIKNEQFRNSENNTTETDYMKIIMNFPIITNHYSSQDLYNKELIILNQFQ